MVIIRAPYPTIDNLAIWPAGPVMGPWTYRPITISQALRDEHWRHVLGSKHLFRCFYRMCTEFLDSCEVSEAEAGGKEGFWEGERKAWSKAFEGAVKKVQKHKADDISQVPLFTEKVRMLHCYMGGAPPGGRDVRLTARFKFRYGRTLKAFGIFVEEEDWLESRLKLRQQPSLSSSVSSTSLSLASSSSSSSMKNDGIFPEIVRAGAVMVPPERPGWEALEVEPSLEMQMDVEMQVKSQVQERQLPLVGERLSSVCSSISAAVTTATTEEPRKTAEAKPNAVELIDQVLEDNHSRPVGILFLGGYAETVEESQSEVTGDGEVEKEENDEQDEDYGDEMDTVIHLWARKSIVSGLEIGRVEEILF